jgi:hypothetical protein
MLYRFNTREESQALVQALVAFVMVMLIMIGIAGTVYRVIAPDGWIAQAFNRSALSGVVALCSIGIVAGMLWLKRGNTLFAKRNKVTEMIVMGFAGLGALFLAQSVVTSLF